ncbi:hypothetical protein EDD17DRAFT_1829691 [Pisolithus thermaeus]|nr:hypothetical protein EDD17DRAFT_1829691 [Pisolithus thermaeus]
MRWPSNLVYINLMTGTCGTFLYGLSPLEKVWSLVIQIVLGIFHYVVPCIPLSEDVVHVLHHKHAKVVDHRIRKTLVRKSGEFSEEIDCKLGHDDQMGSIHCCTKLLAFSDDFQALAGLHQIATYITEWPKDDNGNGWQYNVSPIFSQCSLESLDDFNCNSRTLQVQTEVEQIMPNVFVMATMKDHFPDGIFSMWLGGQMNRGFSMPDLELWAGVWSRKTVIIDIQHIKRDVRWSWGGGQEGVGHYPAWWCYCKGMGISSWTGGFLYAKDNGMPLMVGGKAHWYCSHHKIWTWLGSVSPMAEWLEWPSIGNVRWFTSANLSMSVLVQDCPLQKTW